MSSSIIDDMSATVNKIKQAADELEKLTKKDPLEDFFTNYTEIIKKTYGPIQPTKTGLSASKTDKSTNT